MWDQVKCMCAISILSYESVEQEKKLLAQTFPRKCWEHQNENKYGKWVNEEHDKQGDMRTKRDLGDI